MQRGGGHKSTGDYKYAGSNTINNVAWYQDNSGWTTHEVGQKAPNELGLYDISGNVWECCHDWWDYKYYSKSPQENSVNLNNSSGRVWRGGSWVNAAESCRVAYREGNRPGYSGGGLGLRVARTRK